MIGRVVLLSALVGWIGLTLLAGETRWSRRRSLAARVSPYLVGHRPSLPAGHGVLSVGSFVDVLGPSAQRLGNWVAALFGAAEDLSLRLARVHHPLTPQGFRMRQLGWTMVSLLAGLLVMVFAPPPPPVAMLLIFGGPLLAFLVLEQQLAQASTRRQEALLAELPVVAEQLGMLLSAGYSLGSAIDRLAVRGHGVCAEDLAVATARARQGVAIGDALAEWAQLVQLEAVDRLVGVLRLNRDAGDLGRLVSDEARVIRHEAHRRQIESIERRGQQVWIPVTVAALVPGVIFLAVPFIDAMRLFAAG